MERQQSGEPEPVHDESVDQSQPREPDGHVIYLYQRVSDDVMRRTSGPRYQLVNVAIDTEGQIFWCETDSPPESPSPSPQPRPSPEPEPEPEQEQEPEPVQKPRLTSMRPPSWNPELYGPSRQRLYLDFESGEGTWCYCPDCHYRLGRSRPWWAHATGPQPNGSVTELRTRRRQRRRTARANCKRRRQ